MITQMSNGWYIFDAHEVPRILDALLLAGYQRLPHWFFVHGLHHITMQYSRRGMRILAPPDVWDTYADLFNLGDPEIIAGRLDRVGWRRRPSYGFTGPGAAVTIMSSAITDDELWLDIRGPKPHLVRAALAPLGIETNNDAAPPHDEQRRHMSRSSRRRLPDVTAHARVNCDVYVPNAQIGTIVGARDDAPGTAVCYVQLPSGLIDIYRSTDLEYVTDAAPVRCSCGQRLIYQGFASRTITKEATAGPADWRPVDDHQEPMRVLVLSAVKVWQCRCGKRIERPVERDTV